MLHYFTTRGPWPTVAPRATSAALAYRDRPGTSELVQVAADRLQRAHGALSSPGVAGTEAAIASILAAGIPTSCSSRDLSIASGRERIAR
jgi:hypothetical protein